MIALRSELLAHVTVPEIAHILEGIVRHSDTGIMKAKWSDSDYREMQRHPPLFVPEDVRLIQEGLARRQQSHGARESGESPPAPMRPSRSLAAIR